MGSLKAFISTWLLISAFSISTYGQLAQTEEVYFDVAPVFSRTVNDDQLASAEMLSDIYEGYPSSWIHNYVSTIIVIDYQDARTTIMGRGEALNRAQKEAISDAPIGSQVSIQVLHKDSDESKDSPQEIKFITTVVPSQQATFGQGQDDLLDYMRKQAMDAIYQNPSASFDQAIISFIVDKKGKVLNPKVEESSRNTFIDKLLLNSIKVMPDWSPAKDKDGRAITQRLELRIGNSLGC